MNNDTHEIHSYSVGRSKSMQIFYCGYQNCEAGHAFGPAVRGQYLLHYIVSGSGTYNVRGKSFQVGAGKAFLIKPGDSTYYRADDEDPWTYMWVAFDGIEAPELAADLDLQDGFIAQAREPKLMEEELRRIIDGFHGSADSYAVLGHFYCAMAQFERNRRQGEFEERYVQKAVDYIHNNFSYPVKIFELAKHVGIDRSYLYKLFMAQKGTSPKKYLLSVRINTAKTMLLQNKYSVEEVALSCGFPDSASFCNQFKKATGTSPRRSVKNHPETTQAAGERVR